ncbi:hypothetical protein M413DRAFT_446379 [Hebeloma cylindrosporum]|uniref:Uncharacterized protein n=1 Tax=Hebeloma cylindrosporum TaxID=76867 RepID=A0A0C2YGJ2_HEBCY|nr:hypothetical protein M413DRAFT_446379 [Hebeloma cylindrosporum h7]
MLCNSSIFIVVAVVGAQFVSGQNTILDILSSTCKTTLQGVLIAPDAQCLNLGTFLSVAVTSSGSSNISIPDIANTWLSGLCASGSCSNSTIASIVKNVTTGCADDLNNFGVTQAGITTETILQYAQTFYPPVREIACLKDDGSGKLCVPQTLSALEAIIGKLGVENLDWNTFWETLAKLAAADYKNVACTACTKEAYNIGSKVFPFPDLLAQAAKPISDTCGASFLDGATPPGVSHTAISGEFAVRKSSALSGFGSVSLTGATLFVISSMFVVLL